MSLPRGFYCLLRWRPAMFAQSLYLRVGDYGIRGCVRTHVSVFESVFCFCYFFLSFSDCINELRLWYEGSLEALFWGCHLNEVQRGVRRKGASCGREQVGPWWDPSRLIRDNFLPGPVASPLWEVSGWLAGIWGIQRTRRQANDQLLRAPFLQRKTSSFWMSGVADVPFMPHLSLVNLPIKAPLPDGVWVPRNGTSLTNFPESQPQIEACH